jgi:hypothetical protein
MLRIGDVYVNSRLKEPGDPLPRKTWGKPKKNHKTGLCLNDCLSITKHIKFFKIEQTIVRKKIFHLKKKK